MIHYLQKAAVRLGLTFEEKKARVKDFRPIDGTDIAELMQCFQQKTVNHPKFPAISEAVWNLKETEGGTESMCDIMKQYVDKGRAEGRTEMADSLSSEFAENLRRYGMPEAQIAELVRKSRESAEKRTN